MPMSCSNVINSPDYKSALLKNIFVIQFILIYLGSKTFIRVYYLFGQVILNESFEQLGPEGQFKHRDIFAWGWGAGYGPWYLT